MYKVGEEYLERLREWDASVVDLLGTQQRKSDTYTAMQSGVWLLARDRKMAVFYVNFQWFSTDNYYFLSV